MSHGQAQSTLVRDDQIDKLTCFTYPRMTLKVLVSGSNFWRHAGAVDLCDTCSILFNPLK